MIREFRQDYIVPKEFKGKYKYVRYVTSMSGMIPTFSINMKNVSISNIMVGYGRNRVIDDIHDDLIDLFRGELNADRYCWYQ